MNMSGGVSFAAATPSYWGANLIAAVKNGSISELRVDDIVMGVMAPYYQLGQDQNSPVVDESGVALNFFPRST